MLVYISVPVDVLTGAWGGVGGGGTAAWQPAQIFYVIHFSSEIMEHVVVCMYISIQLQTLMFQVYLWHDFYHMVLKSNMNYTYGLRVSTLQWKILGACLYTITLVTAVWILYGCE